MLYLHWYMSKHVFFLLVLCSLGRASLAGICPEGWVSGILRWRGGGDPYEVALEALGEPGFLNDKSLQQKALKNLDRAVLNDPGDSVPLRMRGFTRFLLSNFQEAALDFQEVLRLNTAGSTQDNLHYLLGTIMMMDGPTRDISGARRHFNAFIEGNDGKSFHAYYGSEGNPVHVWRIMPGTTTVPGRSSSSGARAPTPTSAWDWRISSWESTPKPKRISSSLSGVLRRTAVTSSTGATGSASPSMRWGKTKTQWTNSSGCSKPSRIHREGKLVESRLRQAGGRI